MSENRNPEIDDDREEIATRDEQIAEAIERMKILNFFPATIEQFSKWGKISFSLPPLGGFYWIDDEEFSPIRDAVEEYGGIVFNIIRTPCHMRAGVNDEVFTDPNLTIMDSALYVSKYKSEWESDREELKNGSAMCYVYNRTDPEMSEFGWIEFKHGAGSGLIRTA